MTARLVTSWLAGITSVVAFAMSVRYSYTALRFRSPEFPHDESVRSPEWLRVESLTKEGNEWRRKALRMVVLLAVALAVHVATR